jgi:hypothetical protein
VEYIQLVKEIDREYDIPSGLKVRRLSEYLATLDLTQYLEQE